MTKKFFRNAFLFLAFVLGGIFLNSCSDFISEEVEERAVEKIEEFPVSKIATVSFAISDTETRTVLPDSNEHDLKKYLYLYNYTLTYANGNGGEEVIICNDFSYDKFLTDSTVLLKTGEIYKFTLKAKDGAVTRMEGSSTITLSEKPSQTVTIVLMPAGDEYGQKLRVDWYVPDDGVITTMKAGISAERGHAESQTEEEILDPEKKYRFQEYVFSVIDNPFAGDSEKPEYGTTVKKIELTYDNVKTNVPRWLDYKFYDAKGILVYESSESVYMIGGKTSSTEILITTDHYYRRPVIIPVKKDGNLWEANPELELKLVDNGIEYIFKPVLGDDGKTFTGEFEGLLPGASSGVDPTKTTDGIFDIYVGLEDKGFIKTGAEYNANNGEIKIEEAEADSVKLKTVTVPEKGITLTPTAGVVGTGTDESGKAGLIVPKGQDFTVKVDLDIGYAAENGSTITVGGKPVADGGTVTLNSKDLPDGISYTGIVPIVYSIVYRSEGADVSWDGLTPSEDKFSFTIESDEFDLPDNVTRSGFNFDGWWFENTDNIIHKINKEKAVKEELIKSAEKNNNTLVLNAYWIETNYVEYRIEYKFEKLNSNPVEYITDETVVDKNKHKVVSFHYVTLKKGDTITIPNETIKIPEVPGFTPVPLSSFVVGSEDETKVINYKRNSVTITLDGNGGKWAKVDSTKILSGKFGESHEHVADPEKENHRFLGWYVYGDETETPIKHVDDHTYPAESVKYVAKWEQSHANYTVKYYYEKADSTGYDETQETLTELVGAFPSFDTKPKPGYTYNAHKRTITAGENGPEVNVVTPEGNTLVKLYFDRKTVTFTLKSNGGKFTDGHGNTTEEIILEGKYGTAIPSVDSRGFRVEVPQPPVLDGIKEPATLGDDYTFEGWHVESGKPLAAALPSPFKFPAENAIYAARWTQNNATYEVVHWAESMDKYADEDSYKLLAPKAIDGFTDEQMREGSVTKKGEIDKPMVYLHPVVPGFKTPKVEYKNSTDGKITADGKAEVVVTYLREDYTIRFHLNAGDAKWCGDDAGKGSTESITREGKYRMDFTPPENPVREHFIFRGWTTVSSGTLADRVDVVPSFTEDAPKDYYAVWYSKASGGLEIDTPDITLSCSVNGTEIVANVGTPEGAGVWTYSWTVNNASVSETGKVLTLSDCYKKDYEITVVAKHNGKVYTKTEIVTVTGE